MTIRSSGALALQNAGTNTSETVDNVLLNTSFTAGVDSSFKEWRLKEVGDGEYVAMGVWTGAGYGFNNLMFNVGYVHQQFPLTVAGALGYKKYGNPNVSNFGSLSTTTYSAINPVTRTIGGVFWGIPDSSSPNNVRLFSFALTNSGGSIANNDDAAFEKIEITTNGGTTVTINRTDCSYDASENSKTWWYWYGSSGTMYTNVGNLGTPSNSGYTLKVISGSTTQTNNNGIAEEMGGADSSNVKLSDYYSPGTYIGSGLSGVPSSGEIKFSDFYGKTHIGFSMANGTFDNYYGQPAGSYLLQSGFVKGTHTGQTGNINTFSFQSTTAEVSEVVNLYTSVIIVGFENTATSGTKTYTDAGWTTLKVWHNQSNGNGTPDWTLDRTDADTFNAYNDGGANSSGLCQWWFYGSGSGAGEWPFADYMTTSNSQTHYIEID